MRGLVAVLCATVLAAACDDPPRLPTPPTPIPAPAPTSPPGPIPPPAPATYTVSGVVRIGDSQPVEGARVVLLVDVLSSATTDHDGFYSITGVPASFDHLAPLLSASKPGYFTDFRFADTGYAPIAANTTLDFELVPWSPIAVGEVVKGRLEGSHPNCSHWGYGSSPCERFAVTAPVSGLLEVTLTATVFDFDVDIAGPDGTFVLYDPIWAPVRRYRIAVEAGATYEIRLIGGCCPVREFELRTALH